MKLVFISSRFPTRLSKATRAYHQLRYLGRTHDITLVAPAPRDNARQRIGVVAPFCASIEIVDDPSWKRASRLIASPLSPMPLQTLYYYSPAVGDRVRSLLSSESYDLAHVQLIRMAPVVDCLGSIPRVVDLIDALSLNMSRRAQRQGRFWAWLVQIEARRVHRYEQQIAHNYDRLVVCSTTDRDALGDYSNVHVIPNGVDLTTHPCSASVEMRLLPTEIKQHDMLEL